VRVAKRARVGCVVRTDHRQLAVAVAVAPSPCTPAKDPWPLRHRRRHDQGAARPRRRAGFAVIVLTGKRQPTGSSHRPVNHRAPGRQDTAMSCGRPRRSDRLRPNPTSTLANVMAGMTGRQAGPDTTYKREVIASGAVVASNHPLASAAGIEVLTTGGNAVDAAVATLFALSVVEPMMVSPFGAGFFLIRDGRSGDVVFIDNYASVPAAATPDMYEPVPGSLDYETVGGANSVGCYRAIPTPGALKGWAHAVERYGRLPLTTLVEPAIRFATAGFAASTNLVNLIRDSAEAIARFPATAEVFLPGGRPPGVGQIIVREAYARTLRQIADEGSLVESGDGVLGAHERCAIVQHGSFSEYSVVHGGLMSVEMIGTPTISIVPCSGCR
jgi:hypothetical protein